MTARHGTSLFLVTATALLQAVDGVSMLTAALAILGTGTAPLIFLSTILTERCVPASELTRALAWSGSSSAAGIAVAAGLAGIAVETNGAASGFLLTMTAASLIALAACFATAQRGPIDSSSRRRSI